MLNLGKFGVSYKYLAGILEDGIMSEVFVFLQDVVV